jgi:hypothetical protein
MSHPIHTFAELKQQIHHDLLTQHPEWVEPTGECPECDQHEARLKELLNSLPPSESNSKTEQQMSVEDQNKPSSQ